MVCRLLFFYSLLLYKERSWVFNFLLQRFSLVPDPTHSNEEKGLVLFEQFLGFADLAMVS